MKEKGTAAGLSFLSAFLCIPIHHFYLGNIGLAILYLIVTWGLGVGLFFVTFTVPVWIIFIVNIIEGCYFLGMSEEEFNNKYNNKGPNIQIYNNPPVHPIPNVQQPPMPTPSKKDKLVELKELLDKGILTQEEFDKEKEKILNS